MMKTNSCQPLSGSCNALSYSHINKQFVCVLYCRIISELLSWFCFSEVWHFLSLHKQLCLSLKSKQVHIREHMHKHPVLTTWTIITSLITWKTDLNRLTHWHTKTHKYLLALIKETITLLTESISEQTWHLCMFASCAPRDQKWPHWKWMETNFT